MTTKQLSFTLIVIGLIVGLPVALTNGIIQLSILIGHGIAALIVLGVISCIKLYEWLGER